MGAKMANLLGRLLGSPTRRRSMMLVAAALALVLPAGKASAQSTVDTHMKVFETFDPNHHVSMELNLESFQATTVTGVRYVAPLQASSHQIADTDFVPANSTVEEMVQFIRQAEDGSFVTGDDFFFRFSAHFTYNGNGDLTASFSDLTTECR